MRTPCPRGENAVGLSLTPSWRYPPTRSHALTSTTYRDRYASRLFDPRTEKRFTRECNKLLPTVQAAAGADEHPSRVLGMDGPDCLGRISRDSSLKLGFRRHRLSVHRSFTPSYSPCDIQFETHFASWFDSSRTEASSSSSGVGASIFARLQRGVLSSCKPDYALRNSQVQGLVLMWFSPICR